MNKLRSITIFFNGLYVFVALLFVSDSLTKLEISNDTMKFLVYYGIVFLTVPLLIWNLISLKPRFIGMSVPALVLVLILIIGPMEILARTSTWQTKEIQYESRIFGFIKIAYQMQDNGALGYNHRTVQIIEIAGLLAIVTKIPVHIDTQTQWQPVHRQISPTRH